MQTGTLLAGRYEIGELIRSGGMGNVYEGVDHRLARPVAVKVLHPHLAQPETVQRLFVEARSAAGLDHPNVVAVHDVGEDAGHHFLVMERLPGRTLQDEIAEGPVRPPRVRDIAAQLLEALSVAHERGMLHRDVKPANVLLCDDGSVKLGDFGIAKLTDMELTATGDVLGTIGYLAPEQVAGRPATVQSDLYSLGTTLRHALNGARDKSSATTPSDAAELARVIEVATRQEPSERYADARQMLAALNGEPTVAMTVAPTGEPTRRLSVEPQYDEPQYDEPQYDEPRYDDARERRSSRRWTIITVVAVLMLVATFSIAALVGGSNSDPDPAEPAVPTQQEDVEDRDALIDAVDQLEQEVRP